MNRSNGSHVYVENVEPLTEGTYSCEINTDEPFFMSMQAQQDLRVYGEYAGHGLVASLDDLDSSVSWRFLDGIQWMPGRLKAVHGFV